MPLFWLDLPRFFMQIHVVDFFVCLLEVIFVIVFIQENSENKSKLFEKSKKIESFPVDLPGYPRGLPGATGKYSISFGFFEKMCFFYVSWISVVVVVVTSSSSSSSSSC